MLFRRLHSILFQRALLFDRGREEHAERGTQVRGNVELAARWRGVRPVLQAARGLLPAVQSGVSLRRGLLPVPGGQVQGRHAPVHQRQPHQHEVLVEHRTAASIVSQILT